ncbi:Glu/Leu/Phe/Val dehydrogenase, partial [Acinetobacter soli]
MSLSYADQTNGAWQTYLTQIDRVAPYLDADLSNFVNTLKSPKRTLIVDVP